MALTEIPSELSSTPSIVDGGNATAITIDSSENIGLGVTNPADYYAENLVVAAADEGGITIESATTEKTYLMFADGTSGSAAYRGFIGYDHGASPEIMNIACSGDMNFLTGSSQSEKVRIKEAGQLIVPAGVTLGTGTGVYAAANTLEDYEEGTWTPTFSVTNGAVEIFSARYTKIGRQVIINLAFNVTTAISSGDRFLTFSVPFTQFTAGTTDIGVVSVYPDGNNNNVGLVLNSSSGNTNDFAMAFTLAASFGAGSRIMCKLVYETNQ